MISAKRVSNRLATAEQGLDQFKRKVYRLRRLVAGDASAVYDAGTNENRDNASLLAHPNRLQMSDILVTTIEEGRSNGLLKAIRTLVLQTAYVTPEFEFKNLDPDESAVNAQYLQIRLEECNARDHLRLALLDYCTGGMGWAYTPMRKGKPVVQYADTLDMKWDQTARIPQDIQWASITVCKPLDFWIKTFGSAPFALYLAGRGTDFEQTGLDLPFELEFYYDIEDGGGNYKVMVKTGECDYDEKPIVETTNPCFIQRGTEQEPLLPFESLFFLALPSVRLPIGVAEGMLPAQIAVWEADRTVADIIARGAGVDEVDGSAFEAGELEKYEKGDHGGFVKTKKGIGHITRHAPHEIPDGILQRRQENDQDMTQQSGANPYAMGDKVDGVNFAAQVNAIRADAGLIAGTIAKDNADFCVRVGKKVLAKGKTLDQEPITVRIEGTDVEFGPDNLIAQYLRPDAQLAIREETMQFRPREEKVQEALLMVQQAKGLPMFPELLKEAVKDLLVAMGKENIDKLLTQPVPTMGAPGAPGMPPPPGMAGAGMPGVAA